MNIPKYWRGQAARYRLEGQRRRSDGAVRFPPQPPAPSEAADAWEPLALSGRGTLYSFSIVRQAPSGFEGQGPYLLAIVELSEGPRVTAQLTDCDPAQAEIGMSVEMVTRRLRDTGEDGVLVYGYKFRPVL